MEIRPNRWNETQFLPGSGHIDTAIWVHYMDSNKTAGEEARRQFHKNAASNLEQVLAATPHKTPTVRPPASYHENIQIRRTRHAGHCWRSRDELIRDVLLWIPTNGRAKQDDQHEHTFSSYVRIWDVVLKTCLGRWTIGRSGERGSGISVLPARHDDDDDVYNYYLMHLSLLTNTFNNFILFTLFHLSIFYHVLKSDTFSTWILW